MIIKFIIPVLGIVLSAYTGYYIALALSAFRTLPALPAAGQLHRFAVVVAAKNEEKVIGQLIRSLRLQDYPRELIDIYVIANQCKDRTEEVAREEGATLFELPQPARSKGEALHQFFDTFIHEDHYDAYAVFDADNVVQNDFFTQMNKVVDAGISGAQGFRDSKNPHDSYISASYTLFYYCVNHFYNKVRTLRGMNALITGTGFMLTKEHLRALGGWNTFTLIEDAETTVKSAHAGLTIRFEPTARFYDEQPVDLKTSWFQRLRWSVGSQQVMRGYGANTLKQVFSNQGKDSLDTLFMLCATYVQVLGAILMGLSAWMAIRADLSSPLLMISTLVPLTFMVIAPTVLAVLVLKLEDKPLRPMRSGILLFWFFMLTWIPINFYALTRKQVEWKPIRHDRVIPIEKVTD